MRASRLIRLGRLASLLVLLWSARANAQLWTQIGTLGPSGQALQSVYFWDTHNGIAVGPFQGMWMYRNGIWSQNKNFTGLVPQSLRFIQGVLYAACYREAWKSLDSGRTWQPANLPETLAWDCYLAGDGVVHGIIAPGTVGNLDQNIYGASSDDEFPPLFSTDGGIQWLPSMNAPKTLFGGWSFYADTCRQEFFTMSEEGGAYYSLDSGRSWHEASPSTGSTEDLMEGADGTMYHLLPQGFYRSVDAGFSWDFIGGPGTRKEDYHFQTFGPHGDTIIATVDNQVWKCAGASQNARSDMPLVISDTNIPCGATNIPIRITPYGRRLTTHLRVTSSVRDIDTSFIAQSGSTFFVWLKMDSSQIDETAHIHMQASETCRDYDWSKDITIHRVSPQPLLQTVAKRSEKTCDLFDIPVIVGAADCGNILLDTLEVDSVLALAGSNFTPVDTITAARPDTFHLSVFARHPGQQIARIHLRGRLPEGNGTFDTILKIAITVAPVQYPIATCAKTISISNCIPSEVPIFLQASPCDSVEYFTCDFKIDPALTYRSDLTFPRTLSASEVDTINITFVPQGLSRTSLIKVQITGYDFQNDRSFDTTLQILVTFITSTAELDPLEALVQLDTVSMCSSLDTTVTFRNNGCDTITITQNTTSWQAGWSAMPEQLPIRLAPGESFDLKVHVAPTAIGLSTQYISYLLDGLTNKGVTSQQVRLSVFGVAGDAILTLPDTAFAFDTTTDCNAGGIFPFTLSKSGCDSLLLSKAYLEGSPHFTLDTQSQTQYAVRFTTDSAGTYDARFHIYSVGAHGENAHDTTIAFHAVVTRSPRIATLSTNSIYFGALHYCDVRDTFVTIYNLGCKTIDITSLSLPSKYFLTTATPPLDIDPKDSIRIPIHVEADSTSASSASTLTIASNSDIPLPSVALSSSTIAPDHFALALTQLEQAQVSNNVSVAVRRIGMIPNTVRSLFFSIDYDGDLLTYSSVDQSNVKMTSSVTNGNTRTSFAFSPVIDRDTIATLHFKTALAKQTTSAIQLAVDSIITDITPSDCFVRLDSVGASSARVTISCGDGLMQQLMTSDAIRIQDLRATPSSVIYKIENPFSTPIEAHVSVFDLLGRAILQQNMLLPSGITSRTLPLLLPSGAYALRLETAHGALLKRFLCVPSE